MISGILSECQTVWIQIRTDILLFLVWVQSVYKDYHQTTKIATSRQRCTNCCSFSPPFTTIIICSLICLFILIAHNAFNRDPDQTATLGAVCLGTYDDSVCFHGKSDLQCLWKYAADIQCNKQTTFSGQKYWLKNGLTKYPSKIAARTVQYKAIFAFWKMHTKARFSVHQLPFHVCITFFMYISIYMHKFMCCILHKHVSHTHITSIFLQSAPKFANQYS